MAFTRRVFLSLLGVMPLLATPIGRASALISRTSGAPRGLVVVNGWVLRREDLDHPALQ